MVLKISAVNLLSVDTNISFVPGLYPPNDDFSLLYSFPLNSVTFGVSLSFNLLVAYSIK